MSISDFANVAMALATIVSLIYIARQVSDTRKHTKGQFLLEIDDRLRIYNHIHERLIADDPPLNPDTDDNIKWPEVWQYVGFFERISIMLDDKILDVSLVYRLYGYRIYWIILNQYLFDKINRDPDMWQDFIRLCKAIAVYRSAVSDPYDVQFSHWVGRLEIIETKHQQDWRNC